MCRKNNLAAKKSRDARRVRFLQTSFPNALDMVISATIFMLTMMATILLMVTMMLMATMMLMGKITI